MGERANLNRMAGKKLTNKLHVWLQLMITKELIGG